MRMEPGDEESDIRGTVWQIHTNKITIKGQADFDALLERICSHSRKKYGCKSEGILQIEDGVELNWLDGYKLQKISPESGENDETLNTEVELSRNSRKKRKYQELKGHRDTTEKSFNHKLSGNFDGTKECCVSNSSEIGQRENMTIYEELIRDLNVIASSHDDVYDDEVITEIQEFDNELMKEIEGARKMLRDQLMMSVGYKFLIMNMKLKISNTDNKLEKEKEMQSDLLNYLEDESYLLSQQDKNYDLSGKRCIGDDNDVGPDDEKESEYRQEIARLKESILLADCLINNQKCELKRSNMLLQNMCSKIEQKKRKIDLMEEKIVKKKASTDDTNCVQCNNSNLCDGIQHKLSKQEQFSAKQVLLENTKTSGVNKEYSICYPRDGPSIEKSYVIHNDGKEGNLYGKNEPLYSEDISDHFIKLEGGMGPGNGKINQFLISPPLQNYCSHYVMPVSPNVTSDFPISSYDDYEDDLCEMWLEKVSAGSSLLKIPYEAYEEEAEHVTNHINDAPRALGRSKRGKCKPRFKQTVYRTKAIPV